MKYFIPSKRLYYTSEVLPPCLQVREGLESVGKRFA
jgi:hypothetical protein